MTPDLRAIVRARMATLGITQAALAERLVLRRGGTKDSHVRALSRWQNDGSNIGSDVLADVLAELGGSIAWA
jgi:transcriptional regulator with XRE-family HTH domain